MAQKVKNLPAKAGDLGLIPGSRRTPGEEMATYSSILDWRIPWTEEPGGLQSMGSQRVRCYSNTFTFIFNSIFIVKCCQLVA